MFFTWSAQAGFRDGTRDVAQCVCWDGLGDLGIWNGEWRVGRGYARRGWGEFLPALQTAINLVELHFHPPQ